MKELSCDEVVARVPALVVGDLDASEIAAIEWHTATCEECAEEVDQGRALSLLLDDLSALHRTTEPPDGILSRLQERLRAELPQTAAYERVDSPLGPLYVVATERGLCRIAYGGSEDDLAAWAGKHGLQLVHDAAAVRPYLGQLREYFAGKRQQFDVPIDLSAVTPFTRRVLEATATVPFGRLITYRDVARQIGQPGATRAVGNALGSNPVPIVVPCHRVIRSDGTIGGYTGGLQIKWHLLEIEGVTLATG